MPIENEILRQKRDRAFQVRVLAAVEKPKRNRFLAIINAPIFLWLLSAIAISFLSIAYQTRQQCLQESGAMIMNQLRTQNEINERVDYFKRAVLSAKTAKELQDTLRKRKVRHEQFRTKTLFDLAQDQNTIIAYLPIEDRIKLAQQTINAPGIFILAANAEIDDIDDDTFKDPKDQINEQSPTLPNFTLFIPQCSPTSVIRLVVSGTQEYLRAIPFDQP